MSAHFKCLLSPAYVNSLYAYVFKIIIKRNEWNNAVAPMLSSVRHGFWASEYYLNKSINALFADVCTHF